MSDTGDKDGGVENKGFHGDDDQTATYTASTGDVHVDVKATNDAVFGEKPSADEVKPEIDTRFGYGSCKPRSLQFLNKMYLFVLWAVIFSFLEGFAINGIANAGLPAIERQFQLTSSKSSLIPASQDIGALIVVLFVSFFGSRYNKPSWIATGSLVMSVGSFIFIIPHLAETYKYQGNGGAGPADTCDRSGVGGGEGPGGPACESSGEKYVGVFMLAQIIHGIGFTPMFTLGTAYIDENSEPGTAAVYVGLTYAAAAVGVAGGFFAGGQFLQKYFVDFDRVDQGSLGFDWSDTRWVGSWWIGFVITVIGFVVIAIPIYGYPKYMPANKKAEEVEANLLKDKDTSLAVLTKRMLKAFFKAFLKLLKNPTYVFITLGGCSQSLIIFGVSAFSFKYLIEQYNVAFDIMGYLLGGLILVGAVGMFLGGFLIRVFHLEIVGMLRLNVVTCLIACLLGVSFIAGCPETKIAGLEVPYPNETLIDGYSASCQGGCSCEGMMFNPVCGKDNVVYYSACHAGCTVAPDSPMGSYSNCSCVANSLGMDSGPDATAVLGRCEDGCTNLNILAPCLFIMMVAVLTATTPASMATLRCVDDDNRPFALGVSWLLLRLLGSIPGPVLVGAVIDRACLLWLGGACGGSGFCMVYSHDELAIGVLLWWVIVTAVSTILFFIASIFATRLNKNSLEITKPK